MKNATYRLEPLVRLSERGLGLARRNVVAASRRVADCESATREHEERGAAAEAFASRVAKAREPDATTVRSIAESRVAILLSVAVAARESADRARQLLTTARSVRSQLLEKARVAERDAEFQRSARDRALVLIRERARRIVERRENELALENWISGRRKAATEDDDAR